jgi:hypothetical protein
LNECHSSVARYLAQLSMETLRAIGSAAPMNRAWSWSSRGRDRLRLPSSVEWGAFRWDYAVPIVAIHLLALLAFVPWFFSWTGFIVMLLGVTVFGQLGVPICYHRLLTHRSFRVPKWLER